MRKFSWALLLLSLLVLAVQSYGFSSLTVTPNTTLAAETGNNTSAANTWTTSTNGGLGASNISKVDHRTLLYPGATTQIYTNIMYWFGPSNHIQVGYWSNDYNQVKKQVDDHLSRGLAGTIVDWYGTSHTVDNGATLYLKQYAESLPGYPFKFAIMEDKGALSSCANTAGCDVNARLISDLTYVMNTYGSSPAYMRVGGQPAIFFFGCDKYAINWDYVKANVPRNPAFLFQNAGGYTHADTSGAYSWVMINTSNANDWEQSYLDNFYQQSLNNATKHDFGTAYKGFNDTLAAWSLNRIMNQNCGQTWLNTWNEIAKYYNSSPQLESLQITTWNDYEEGTEIESGIDNCVSIAAAVSGSTVSWSITGNENTLDHYTVFISTDGQNLMSLANVAAGIHALDLSQFGIAPGNYVLYIKAVGKPSLLNHMSAAVNYTVADQPPVAALSVTPISGIAPVTVTASTAASSDVDGTIASSTINFGDGTTVNGPTASHTYSAAGTYTVTATVYDNAGLAASKTATVTVTAPGVTITTPTNGATVTSPVHFVASAYASKGIASMRIYVDSQSMYTAYASKLDTYVTLAAGTRYVVIQAWDNGGTVYKSSITINVSSTAPTASLSVTPTTTTTSSPVSATLTGSGAISSYRIDFGDGSVATTATASHAYAAAGTYTVKGTVTNSSGLSATSSATVTVSAPAPATTVGVTVTSPVPGSTVGSPVHFVASAVSNDSSHPITSMRIYVDGISKYTVYANKLDTYVSLTSGSHNCVVQAWDSAGTVYKTSLGINVN